ncbi:MAG TPA: hypothetical protein VNF99_20410 [Stellaceae bacterium]|nr:hypothetical protein [Stellaceae bacterium]
MRRAPICSRPQGGRASRKSQAERDHRRGNKSAAPVKALGGLVRAIGQQRDPLAIVFARDRDRMIEQPAADAGAAKASGNHHILEDRHAFAERGGYRKEDIDHSQNRVAVLGDQNDADIRIGNDASETAALRGYIRSEFGLLRK